VKGRDLARLSQERGRTARPGRPTGDALAVRGVWDRPAYFSLGGYGPWRGLDRILRLLAERAVRPRSRAGVGWFEHWPLQCRRIVERDTRSATTAIA